MGTEVFLPTSQAGVTRLVHNEGYIIREINVKKYIMNNHYSNDSMDTDSYQKFIFTSFFIKATKCPLYITLHKRRVKLDNLYLSLI